MKANDMFSMFLEVVGYLVICGSAGYLIVHLLVWLDGAVNWLIKRWQSRTVKAPGTSAGSDSMSGETVQNQAAEALKPGEQKKP